MRQHTLPFLVQRAFRIPEASLFPKKGKYHSPVPFSARDGAGTPFGSQRVTYRFLLTLCLCLLCATAQAAQTLHPGFKTLGVWEPDSAIRLDFAIWYPARRSPFKLDYGDWVFSAARGATPLQGRHPLILLSHDSPGSRFSLHALASELARNGFVVAAPTHAGDNLNDMRLLYTGAQLVQRARQLYTALDILLQHPATASLIDSRRIGILGVGPGGTAALMLAGGRLDPRGWDGYCTGKTEDPYCQLWTRSRMEALAATPGLDASFLDKRILAAAAVAPTYGMLLTPGALSSVHIPVLLLGAEKEPLCPPRLTEAIRDAFSATPEYAVIPDADAITLTSPCGNGTLVQTLPELCRPVPERAQVQADLAESATRFFLDHLQPAGLPEEDEQLRMKNE